LAKDYLVRVQKCVFHFSPSLVRLRHDHVIAIDRHNRPMQYNVDLQR